MSTGSRMNLMKPLRRPYVAGSYGRQILRAAGPLGLCAALSFLGGCKALGLMPAETVTSEKVLGDLESRKKTGPDVPEIVQLQPLPMAPAQVAPPPPPARSGPFAARTPDEASFDEDTTVRASMKHDGPAKPHGKRGGRQVAGADRGGGGKTHVVQRGETLQKISQKYYGTTTKWTKIYEANRSKLKRPDLIVVGTKLVIP